MQWSQHGIPLHVFLRSRYRAPLPPHSLQHIQSYRQCTASCSWLKLECLTRLCYSSGLMAITKSAKKAARVSVRKQVFNLRNKRKLHDVTALTRKATGAPREEQVKQLSAAYSAIDKAAKRGVIKKNTAARKKALLAALLKRSSVK